VDEFGVELFVVCVFRWLVCRLPVPSEPVAP